MLDGEARARGTTVYLVDRRLDMLPGPLSEDAASLLAGVDRLAVSALWRLGRDMAVKSVWFGRTVIRCSSSCPRRVCVNCALRSYTRAQPSSILHTLTQCSIPACSCVDDCRT